MAENANKTRAMILKILYTISVVTLFGSVVWIGVSLYERSVMKSQDSVLSSVSDKIIKDINPSLDVELLKELSLRD